MSQPFTAPAVRPATNNRCSSTKVAITGTREVKLAAATSCHSVSYPLWKLKRPTGMVKRRCDSGPLDNDELDELIAGWAIT